MVKTTAPLFGIIDDEQRLRKGARWRTVFYLGLVAVIALAATGLFGVHPRTIRGTDGAAQASLTYAQTARRGVTTAWELEVDAPGGFRAPVIVSLTNDYLDRLAMRGVSPTPTEEHVSTDATVWTFAVPSGETIVVRIDAQIDGSATPGWADGITDVSIGSHLVTQLTYRTWVWP